MQIMPRTALYEFGVQRKKLFNPDLNIKIGIKFLDHLISKYNGRIDIAYLITMEVLQLENGLMLKLYLQHINML